MSSKSIDHLQLQAKTKEWPLTPGFAKIQQLHPHEIKLALPFQPRMPCSKTCKILKLAPYRMYSAFNINIAFPSLISIFVVLLPTKAAVWQAADISIWDQYSGIWDLVSV